MRELKGILNQFQGVGAHQSATAIAGGHINDTWLMNTTSGRFVLQRINHHVFRDVDGLMANIQLVTQSIRDRLNSLGVEDRDRLVLELIPTHRGEPFAHSTDGGRWRVYRYIEHSRAAGAVPRAADVFQAGLGFGRFVAWLAEVPGDRLVATIPNFHHGPARLAALVDACGRDLAGRAVDVRAEVELVRRREPLLAGPQQALAAGRLPLRVTHNDAKSSNVLLDEQSGEALAVIDLDTVMPGLVLYDFGDLLRTCASSSAEDDPNTEALTLNASAMEAAAEGFLSGAGGVLSGAERESLAIGPAYMALIMATRFLTDYLEGDVYFKTGRPGHNLDRARNQLALTALFEQHHAGLTSLLGG
ncbi:N-acetylhexosamine 1-kinase [Posidoniimonas polymericola]|uniref:N-acetylhexosamine 1-kinase n=1 Tax=Posidoniimonas polymericola TaxID=2528002 RepID=A0A5C5XVL4_9BACT|nr:aminoglycoside phosphotransferase family protein [Posidoniimonas polymericola]TWT66728.1 N-acetylhexosamine 1-kinase [Posidoniimonas polymericola]